MPYRFSFNIPQGRGSDSADSLHRALEMRIQQTVYHQLQPLANMLEQMMPVLTDEEYRALPRIQQQYFTPHGGPPQAMPQHNPFRIDRVLIGNSNINAISDINAIIAEDDARTRTQVLTTISSESGQIEAAILARLAGEDRIGRSRAPAEGTNPTEAPPPARQRMTDIEPEDL